MFEPQNIGTDLNIDGEATSTNSVPTWESGINYSLNSQRVYENILYVNILAVTTMSTITPDMDTTHWAPAGTGGGSGGSTNVPNVPAETANAVRYVIEREGLPQQVGSSFTFALSNIPPALVTTDAAENFNAFSINNPFGAIILFGGIKNTAARQGNLLFCDNGTTGTALTVENAIAEAGRPICNTVNSFISVLGGQTVENYLNDLVIAYNFILSRLSNPITALRSGDNIVFYSNTPATNFTAGTTLSQNGVYTSVTGGTESRTIPGVQPPPTWINRNLFSKIELFLGTEGASVPNQDPQLTYTPYTTYGVEYYFFPNRDNGNGAWSDTTDLTGNVWNLIG